MYNDGDRFTYVDPVSRAQSTLTLRGIDEEHLKAICLTPGGTGIAGFHVLPVLSAGLSYTASTPVMVPAGFVGANTVKVFDERGNPIAPGSITITIVPDANYNNDPYNMFRATVTVVHPGGIATGPKTFFPPAWTWANVKQAIYDALVTGFQANGPLPNNTWIDQRIPGGARIRFLYDEYAANGLNIGSAFPVPGQNLGIFNQPDMTRP